MAGVDLVDMLVALYCTGFRTHRWYMGIFSQILDICVNNAWLLFRREATLLQITKPTKLKDFRYYVIERLLLKNKKRGRPSNGDIKCPGKRIHRPMKARPGDDVRFDSVGYFPKFIKKGRCRNCPKDQTSISCLKCD
ncbi:hypothetical protein NQ314_006932 [Rhamnusium bicolor]|uniref:PiggyBac transposable element-derived protein domain-containing protein n=1 Tax=Rhamnusium bicolor TaxID=1586634 RepID=A0AAV8YVS2_9CUCU|nr:hypothetical protein NQ314_006932 [Rhamnusium bicolor]